eukprot:56638_1
MANKKNADQLNTDEYQLNCCVCYMKSVTDNIRYDLSYCIPSCGDCNYCKVHQGSFDRCPFPGYDQSYSSNFNWNWYEDTGCLNEHQSITSMIYFIKSYTAYGYIALALTTTYAAFNFLLIVLTCCGMRDMTLTFFRWTWIYNVGITEVCLYLMLKPFQYKNIHNGFCQIDSISEFYENVLTYSILCSLALVTLQLLWVCGWIIYYIFKCVKSCKDHHRGRNVSVDLDINEQIQRGVGTGYIKLPRSSSDTNDKKVTCCGGFIGIITFLVMLCFLILVIMIACKTLNPENEKNHKLLDKPLIYVVYVLLVLSLVDNPWLCTKFHALRELITIT